MQRVNRTGTAYELSGPDFRNAYDEFAAYMKSVDLVADSGPVGQRQSDTPMDTDDERNHEYIAIMSFRNRAQVDAAYTYNKKHVEPVTVVAQQRLRKSRKPNLHLLPRSALTGRWRNLLGERRRKPRNPRRKR